MCVTFLPINAPLSEVQPAVSAEKRSNTTKTGSRLPFFLLQNLDKEHRNAAQGGDATWSASQVVMKDP